MIDILEYIIISYGIGEVIFNYILEGALSRTGVLCLFYAVIINLPPNNTLHNILFNDFKAKIDTTPFLKADRKLLFKSDYDRCNPVTKQRAEAIYSKNV